MKQALQFLTDAAFVFSVIFIWLMILYQFVLTIGGFLWRRQLKKTLPEGAPAELPGVSVLIPARNEARVIGGLLTRIGEFDYPAEKIEVVVVNDGSTDRTREILEEFSRRDGRIKVVDILPAESGKGKGAALNQGLAKASHEVVAVYDSDNIPERDSLKKLCLALARDKRLAGVTGMFRAYNKSRNLLTRLINLESIAFQWIVQAGRWQFLKIAFLPGTNFVLRRSALVEAGGWDEEALTEDSELTFRLYQKKLIIQFLPTAVTWEQEPEGLRAWVRQRTRWARGNNYIIAKHGRRLLRSKPSVMAVEILNFLYLYYFFIFAIILSDVLFVLSAFKAVHLRVMGPYRELWALAFLLFILEILVALSFEGEDSLLSLAVAVLAYLAYTKLWAFVVLRGFYEESIAGKKRVWVKTERVEVDAGTIGSDRQFPRDEKRRVTSPGRAKERIDENP
jgi:cellulose synthase/poly-beta-1,6-N-acetylglucosamine synthase-like glycosyltransferase